MHPIDIDYWLDLEPFSLKKEIKAQFLTQAMKDLTFWHSEKCIDYNRIIKLLGVNPSNIVTCNEVPFLPVKLFKDFELLSIAHSDIFKTMTSSGTTGQQVSKIFLDRMTAQIQSKVLSRLMGCLLGSKRVPMLVIDSPSVLKNRHAFSARGAGILGFSMFGRDVTYALDDEMKLNVSAVESFLSKHEGSPIFVFGFTFMIWQYLLRELARLKHKLPIENGIILHGGGWKKLKDQSISNEQFREEIKFATGASNIVNYYGMVEQTGSLYLECAFGNLHAPIYSDVIIRRANDFEIAENGEPGIIQTMSILPFSYPGHSLLTEDLGVLIGEDNCACGRYGKYFHVLGRLEKAEIRGCSDTHEGIGQSS